MKFIQGIFGLIIVFYIGFLPIYIIFYNSPKDAVRDLSLYSNSLNEIKFGNEYAHLYSDKEAKFLIDALNKTSEEYENKGIDVYKPIYDVLKEYKNIRDLEVEALDKDINYGLSYSGCQYYAIKWKVEGRSYAIPVMVIPPSFFKVRRAFAVSPDTELLRKLYGI